MKAWYGEWKDMKVVDLNRILKAHGVRLVVKTSKEWGKNCTVTAHPIGIVVKRVRAVKGADGGLHTSGAVVVAGVESGKAQ